MPDHEVAMIAYVKLADLSQQKNQMQGRDKFLVLAGAAACRAGWPDVTRRCRALIISNNCAHLIRKSKTFSDAMRDDEFQPFLKQLERFCSYEQSEHLLSQLNLEPGLPKDKQSISSGEYALQLLTGPHWPTLENQ